MAKTISTARKEWRLPWFSAHYGSGRVVRDTGVMATAVAADWSRGVSIEQIRGQQDTVAFLFALCWVLVPGGTQGTGARRLAIRSTLSPQSRSIVGSLLRAWVIDEVSESELMSIAKELGAVSSPEAFKSYQRAIRKQLGH